MILAMNFSDWLAKEEMWELIKSIDTLQLFRDTFLDGFDTYEDYFKYGDAFVKLKGD